MKEPSQGGPRAPFIRRFFYRGGWLWVLTAYAALVVAAVFPHDFRNVGGTHAVIAWTTIMIRNYMYHFGALMVGVALLSAVFRCFGMAICIMPFLLFTIGKEAMEGGPKTPPPVGGDTFTLMTLNLNLTNDDAAAVLREIDAAKPDAANEADKRPEIILFQEYTAAWNDLLRDKLIERGYHDPPVKLEKDRDDLFGTAVYIKKQEGGATGVAIAAAPKTADELPRRDAAPVYFGGKRVPHLRVVITLGEKKIAVYNLHLFPTVSTELANVNRLQTADLLDRLRNEKLPAIVAGGFNYTHRSPQGKALEQAGLVDAFAMAGEGRGGNWRPQADMDWFPPMRMDHIYLTGELAAASCHTSGKYGSDHVAVIAEIGFKNTDSDPQASGE